MINVQDLIARAFRVGVNASMVEFGQHIFTQFKALKGALLIFDAFDRRVLHQLRVESNKLIRDAFQRIYAPESARPRVDVLNPAFERRREPSFRSCSVVETGLPISDSESFFGYARDAANDAR